MMQPSLVHLYTGNGKGKTTAAIGLCIRALGRGKKVLFCQFLKDNQSGEISVLQKLDGATVLIENPVSGFLRSMPAEQQQSILQQQHHKWEHALSLLEQQDFDLVVFDEIMAAIHTDCISAGEVTHFLENRQNGLEVVLTGRNPPEELCQIADYHSNIDPIKHPYSNGIPAREGIEF